LKIYHLKEEKNPLNITSSDVSKQENTVNAHPITLYLIITVDHSITLKKEMQLQGSNH